MNADSNAAAAIMLLNLFFGPPLVAAIILSVILNMPFRRTDFPSRAFLVYWGIRLGLAIGGFVALLVFKSTGGYTNILSSEFSPIGTDERGLVIYWMTIGVIAFGTVSLIELAYVLGRRLLKTTRANR